MADKAFGVDQLDILGNGTPTISAPNQLNLDCHTVAISTSVTVGANLTVNGNIDLGNASSDTISLTGVVDTNIIPSADSSKDIGSNSVRFANGYFDTVYGSGANLTSLPAANLTGTLPAISGANLTNLPTIAGIWSVGHNGASNYVISGPGGLSSANNPDLYLERGKTYQFVVNASGHPFGIQTVSGTWTGSNAYTTGITNPAAQNGTITFAVPYSAPARLYYACTSQHSGMVGNIYIRGAAGNNTNVGVTTIIGANGNLLNVNHTDGGGAQGVIRTKASQANSSSFIRAEDSGNTYIGLLKYGTGHSAYGALGAGDGAIYANSGGGNDVNITLMADSTTGHINFATGGNTERMKINKDGIVTKPQHPVFSGRTNVQNNIVSGIGVIQFTADVNNGNHWSNSPNWEFTCPVAGFYYMASSTLHNGETYLRYQKQPSGGSYSNIATTGGMAYTPGALGFNQISSMHVEQCNAGDKLRFAVSGSGANYYGADHGSATIFLIG